MKIANISVDGYRLLNDFRLDLRDDLSLVIGKNNTGKTSLLNILRTYLSSSTPRLIFEDFSVDSQKSLLASLVEKTMAPQVKLPRVCLTLEISYDEKDNLRNLSKLMVDLSPEARTVHLRFTSEMLRDQFETLHADCHENLRAIEEALGDPLGLVESTDEVRRFLVKNLGNYLTHAVVSFDPTDASNVLDLSKERSDVSKVLNLEYVSARRAVENKDSGQEGKSSGRALSQLSSSYFKDHTGGNESTTPFIQLAAQSAITDRAFTEVYAKVFQDVIDKVKRFGAIGNMGEDIHVISVIKPGELLSGSTAVSYGEPGSLLPEDHNGLGILNLIAIIMEIEIRLLRIEGTKDRESSDINLLMIEEPEAHTHPQLQYIFIKKIKELLKEHKAQNGINLQTIITTHSSHITAESDFSDIKYFRRVGDHVEARNMTDLKEKYKEDPKAYHFLSQYLTLTRAELFFADKAVLIEGDTERILMRAMMQKIDEEDPEAEESLTSQNISVVEIGAYSQIFDHFIDFTGLKTLIITDIDSARVAKDKNGKDTLEACPVEDGSHTTNSALEYYLCLPKSGPKKKGTLDQLRGRAASRKQLKKKGDKWVITNSDPMLRIAYQIAEEGYEARSYEDAFISINREFVKENLDDFRGVKHRDRFLDDGESPYDLANKCVAKKTHFALDIIYASTVEDDPAAGDQTPWKIPAYIAEGLRWLRDA